jgi:Zn-dependent peptidase ImmA (M78 family)
MFAASILMPKAIIAGAINQIKETRQVVFPDLYKLRDQFEVSISALVNRVNQLGILYAVDNKVYSSKAEATGQLVLF